MHICFTTTKSPDALSRVHLQFTLANNTTTNAFVYIHMYIHMYMRVYIPSLQAAISHLLIYFNYVQFHIISVYLRVLVVTRCRWCWCQAASCKLYWLSALLRTFRKCQVSHACMWNFRWRCCCLSVVYFIIPHPFFHISPHTHFFIRFIAYTIIHLYVNTS